MVIVQWMINHRHLIFLVKSCWSPIHSRNLLPIHYRNLESHQSSFPPFPILLLYWVCWFFPLALGLNSNHRTNLQHHCGSISLLRANSWWNISVRFFHCQFMDDGRECHHLVLIQAHPFYAHTIFFHIRHSYEITSQISGEKWGWGGKINCN